MSVTSEKLAGMSVGKAEPTGLSFYFKEWKWTALGMVSLLVLYVTAAWYQQTFGHLYGMDSHSPEFDKYWMGWLYTELTLVPIIGIVMWTYVWVTRPRNETTVAPKEEVRRYFNFVMWLLVYTFGVYWAASFFAEQDGAWHQVVTRDTSFTPSHIMLFYLSFPVYIVLGVGSLIYAWTRLPLYRTEGVSVAHVLGIVGPLMILPNVGLNEWGHAFWFMEELFTAPLHWGFVVLGWSGLALGGVLMQIVMRINALLPQIEKQAS